MRVELLDSADAELVAELADLVNRVYEVAEDGLWRNGATRTTPAEMSGLIDAGEIAVATIDGELAGAVRVQVLDESTGEFGMLVADPERRGVGVGSALVTFAERHCSERGLRTMQLEVLVPRTWRHPSKVRLDDWYRRIGYQVARKTEVDELYPELAPLLATPCDFVVYEKTIS
jgi:ribosomal protein S18 acetylase RimI-like enzyme